MLCFELPRRRFGIGHQQKQVLNLALPMDLSVVSFTLAVKKHSSGRLNFKNMPTVCPLL